MKLIINKWENKLKQPENKTVYLKHSTSKSHFIKERKKQTEIRKIAVKV